ncbi:hypothetical protein D9615_002215 [Tricholomella constricta]|uniref:Csf1 N-terminal domain-containing protein n=1 Tax=Tricholomella constricta TaxID=117010 RepID=A0A8H5HME7_9AGAR|nr:hypothetical protein D9615_002215 [Tricholomella constricta]
MKSVLLEMVKINRRHILRTAEFRTAAYDSIISQMEARNLSRPVSRSTDRRQSFQKSSRPASSSPFHPPSSFNESSIPYGARKAVAWIKRQLPNLDPKDLLPLGIEVTKGAITCGNNSTPSLLVAEFQRSEGTFGIVEARSKFDLYKQLFSMKFQHATIRYVENENYADPMTSMGELVHGRIIQYSTLSRPSSYLTYRSFVKLWDRLGLLALARKYTLDRRDIHAMQKQRTPRPSKKTHKNLDEPTPIGADFTQVEYAVERKILETPVLDLSYYYDVVGEVPALPDHFESAGVDPIDIGNSDVAPEWGFDITISGGVLKYGPWADRQRVELQKAFFPPTYHDGEITPPLKPGDKRLWTAMRVFVELRENTLLHIPFREPSKDWQWDGKTDVPQRQRVREAAAIHVTVGDRSSISYILPMVTGSSGYRPVLEAHLDTIAITSSLNDIRLVTAESSRIHCELPTPLKWNTERTWIIDVVLRQPVLYLLRDHINMFIDLGKDWTTGPPSDYQRFIPMIYAFKLEMHHFELNMYANDHNIIDKPLIRDENDVSASLSLPRWNTNALHAPKEGNSLANIHFFRIDGSYEYFAEVWETYVEQLKLNFTVREVAFKELGWAIRYFMVLRDNYLGSFTHFSTLYEYLERRKRKQPLGDPILSKYRPGKNNMLQAEVQLYMQHGIVIMPAGLPGYSSTHDDETANAGIGECLIVTIPELQLQFRMHDYYMEMSLNVGALAGGLVSDYPEKVTYRKTALHGMKDILRIDGLDITANRLFGPQPRTATYICIWEIHLGRVKALLSASEGRLLAAAGDAVRLNYADFANAPATEYLPPVDPDVTFLKFSLKSVDITWRAGQAALVITLPSGIKVDSNDVGGQYYRKAISLRITEISVKVLLAASLHGGRWLEALKLTADAYLDIYSAPLGFRNHVQAQIAYVEEQDRLTGRARRIFATAGSQSIVESSSKGAALHKNGVYIPHPMLPSRRHSTEAAGPSQSVPRGERIRNSWTNMAQLSESDAEEGISEADRDARLAKTRSSTPAPHFNYEDDQNMTSGDESDDEDLTDASSDSDWSEFANEDASNSDRDQSILRHYVHVTRHYAARFLESPELWDGCPFILVRDRTPLDMSREYPTNPAEGTKPQKTADTPKVPSDDQGSITFRYRGKKPIIIQVTPLVSPAAVYFEEDMRKNPLSPELCLDAMMASHLGTLSASGTTTSCTLFEASIPSAIIHVMQRILMTDGHPSISQEFSEASKSSALDVISVVQGHITGIFASGTLIKGNPVANVGFSRLSLSLDTSINRKTITPRSPREFVFNYGVDDFKMSVARNTLKAHWEESTIQLGQLGPEYMAATGIALMHSATQLYVLGQRWEQYSSSLEQTIVYDIIQCSGQTAVVDPLSTIQPSYLVQSGTPHVLRTNTTFRFLYHLRSCLWNLDVYERGSFRSLQDSVQPVDLDELMTLLESRLHALDPDAYNIHLSSLEPFLPILRTHDSSSATRIAAPSNRSISIQFSKLAFVVLDPSCVSPSELVVTNLDTRARMRASDVLPLPPLYPTSMSQTSLKEKRSQSVFKTSALISVGDVTLSVFPHLMGFAQNILRVRRHYYSVSSSAKALTQSPSVNNTSGPFQLLSTDVIFSLRHLQIQAAAENLVFEFGLSGVRGTSSALSRPRAYEGQSISVLLDKVYVRARSPSDMVKRSDQDILASLELTTGKVNTVSRKELTAKAKHRLAYTVGGLQFHVPRSALRLYRFVQEWRADFLPGIEATVQALLAELQRAPSKPTSPQMQRTSSRRPSFQVQGQVSHVGISLQVMHGTWLSWEADNIISYVNSSNTTASEYTFGLQLASVTVSVSSKPNAREVEPSTRVKLILPPLSATGHYDGTGVHAIALMDFIELKVKPSHWDTLLIVQQKFGQDFHDLVTLVQKTNLRQAASKTPKDFKDQKPALKYSGFLKVRGFRVGLEGPSSTVYLECLDIGSGINNSTGLTWNVDLSDLAFSLAPRAVVRPNYPGFNRNHRSAFVIIDFKVDGKDQLFDGASGTVILISLTKIHAVMQPSSIGEVGDFIDHLQAEMLDRKERRALELAAFKDKTQSILRTFEVGVRDTQAEKRPWLENFVVNVSTRNIGVAFPLTHDQDLQLPQTGSKDSTAVPAFLWSIKSIEFGTHRGETGQAVMKSFSFQFVSRFRQSIPGDFSGESHQTRNRLIYPEMEAQLRSIHSASSRHVWIGANVSGFILDLDSSIPSYVFSLIDVYRQGKDRMDRLSSSLPRTPSAMETENDMEKEPKLERHHIVVPASSLFASLKFLSGKVRVYSGAASRLYRTRPFSHSHQEPSDEQVMEIGAEVFNLPVVSVWAEYRTTPATQKHGAACDLEPSILMFKSTVHSSQNTLRPTLLPFLTELVSHIEARLRRVSLQSPRPVSTVVTNVSTAMQEEALDTVTSMRISFSLRIDQSKLELTCQPDVNVIAGLHWDSGGFVVNVSPGARNVTFTGSVGGLTLGLKHGFLSEDCVMLDARNLAFSVTFAKVEADEGASVSSVSVVLDTEFLGVVRFSRLQDILCFKAVWLDRIPIFNSQTAIAPQAPARTSAYTPSLSQPKQRFSTMILVRIRQITLDVDLGQSISAMTLDLTDAVMRTKLTDVTSELSVFVADFAISAKGNVAGHAHVPKCVFQTIRSVESSSNVEGISRMLELSMTSGPLVVSLESDHQKLLHYRAEPLEVKIFDDWLVMAPRADAETKPLQLSFTVTSPEIVAVVTVGTIPKLLAYVNKFKANLDAQRLGASRESKAFRVTRTPKPDNPLSAVAEAMLQSARSRFKEAENGLSYVIMQHMSLQLDFLRLVVFPRTMDDLEIAQFIGRDVRARLDRLIEFEPNTGKRDLLLSFSSMTISKYTGLGHPQTSDLSDGRDWLESLLNGAIEAIIVGLPSMTMHMVSEEQVEDLPRTLVYDFHSEFVRREGNREFKDIFITLNVSLYSWLTILRKNLTREMEQVKATTDWRALLNTASPQAGASRKKTPEPLSLDATSSRSSTMPSPASRPFSPFSPSTALKSSVGVPMGTLSPPVSTPPSASISTSPGPQIFPSIETSAPKPAQRSGIVYQPRSRHIERLTMRQLGEATPDVMHPFFMKKAGFNLEDSLPQYVNEYATAPLEEIMEVLLKLYSRQLLSGNK